ncbi:MAG: hypothetical protein N2Z22_04455, partial [Turneriella sp.]|nr:hypothetical protein [Turneriella sp.]
TEPLHLVAGICGGALLTISSHGTDQLIVQKVLACRNLRDAQKAMIASGILADLQFLLFLFIGVWLFAFFNGQQFASPDAIFPQFIVAHLPAGITGLVLAAIFATGQSTLSATVTALASSTMLDLFPQLARTSERRRIQIAQLFTLFWTVGIVAIAFLFTDSQNPVVVVALKLSSLVAGAVVGLYILGFLAVAEKAAFAGFMVSVVGVGLAAFSTPLAWTWYVPLGTVLALLTALAVTVFHKLISRGR